MNSVLKFFCRDWRMSETHTHDVYPSVDHSQRQAGDASHGSSWWNSPRWWHYLPTTWIKGTPHDEIPVILVILQWFFFGTKKRQVLNRHGNVLRTPVPGIPNPSWGVHPHRHSHLWCQLVTFPCWKFIFCWILETSAKSMSLLHAATFQLRHGGQMRQWKLLRGWSFFSNA